MKRAIREEDLKLPVTKRKIVSVEASSLSVIDPHLSSGDRSLTHRGIRLTGVSCFSSSFLVVPAGSPSWTIGLGLRTSTMVRHTADFFRTSIRKLRPSTRD